MAPGVGSVIPNSQPMVGLPRCPRRDARRAPTFAVGLVALPMMALAAPRTALAFERQHHLGVDLGVSHLRSSDPVGLRFGPYAGLHYTYGLSDMFNLVLETGYARFGVEPVPAPKAGDPPSPPQPEHVLQGAAGVMYLVDVLRWVPYVGVLASATSLSGGNLPSATFTPGLQLGAGLDYQFDRHWAAGLAYRQHFLLTAMGDYPLHAAAFARFEYVWGW